MTGPTFGFCGLLALLIALATGAAQQAKPLRIGTGGAGGTYYPIGKIIASATSGPGLAATAAHS